MGLQKQVVDIGASDGLQQKFDPRRLPAGKAALAINLMKNKQGRLEKRLGFTNLPETNNTGAQILAGISVGETNGNLFKIGRFNYPVPAGPPQKFNLLQTYSDDLGEWVSRGPVPEMTVVGDDIFANCPSASFSTTSILSGDLLMVAWLAYSTGGSGALSNVNIWYCVKELSTGNFVQPPQVAFSSFTVTTRASLELVLCGTTAVIVYSNGTLFARSLVASAWATTTWSSAAEVTLNNTENTRTFQAVSVTGDATHFVVIRETDTGAAIKAYVEKYPVPLGTATNSTLVYGPQTATGSFAGGCGVRADSNNVCGAFSVYEGDATATNRLNKIYAFVGDYGAWTFGANILIHALGVSAGTSTEQVPPSIAVGYAGLQGGGILPTWGISWSPTGSRFSASSSSTATTGGNSTPWLAGADPNSTTFNNAAVFTTGVSKSGTTATQTFIGYATYGVHLVSKFLEANGILYCLGWVPSNVQGTYYVLAADFACQMNASGDVPSFANWPMRPVASLQTRTALDNNPASTDNATVTPTWNQNINNQTTLANWILGSDAYTTAYVTYVATSQGQKTMPALGSLQTTPRSGYQSAQYGTALGVSGGVPTVFDGANVFEQSFCYTPESFSWAQAAGTGPNWAAAGDVYSWIVTYEHFDAQGNFHISGRSPPLSVTGQVLVNAGSGALPKQRNITLNIPSLGVTMRAIKAAAHSPNRGVSSPSGSIVVGVYRTKVNGTVYYRVADRYFNLSDSFAPGIANNTDISALTFVDGVSDANLTDGTHPLLYSDGTNGQPGTQDNLCPPASLFMVKHKERLFTARKNEVLYTKARADLVGPGYEDLTQVSFVGGDDTITGMASMDDKLVVLKRNQIFYIGGDGPADDGGGNSFTPPQPIPTDVGCTDARSVRSTPEGVYFLSDAGLRLLTRGLSVEYAGGPVEDYLSSYPVMTGVSLYPNNNKVAFLANLSDHTTFGFTSPLAVILWRDYVLDAWTSAFISFVQGEGSDSQPLVGSAVAFAPQVAGTERVLHLLEMDGTVLRENDPGTAQAYFDKPTGTARYIQSTWATPWIKTTDQSRFRVWDIQTLIESMDAHGLTIQVATNYGTIPITTTWAWSSGAHQIAPSGTTPMPLTQLRTYDGRLVESFQVGMTDVTDSATVTGQGPRFLGLTATIGVTPGPVKLPTSSTQ